MVAHPCPEEIDWGGCCTYGVEDLDWIKMECRERSGLIITRTCDWVVRIRQGGPSEKTLVPGPIRSIAGDIDLLIRSIRLDVALPFHIRPLFRQVPFAYLCPRRLSYTRISAMS